MLLVTGQHEHCIAHLHMPFTHVFGAMTVYHQFMWMWLSLTVFSSKFPISNFHLPTNSSLLTDWLATWFVTASPLTCLKDKPRKGEKLTLSPSGTLAAITDSLGRILLLDTQALVVVRLWKVFLGIHKLEFYSDTSLFPLTVDLNNLQGYRDASCLFMEMLVNRDTAAASSSSYYEPVKSDYCLCLAIHAPRKGIVEVCFCYIWATHWCLFMKVHIVFGNWYISQKLKHRRSKHNWNWSKPIVWLVMLYIS